MEDKQQYCPYCQHLMKYRGSHLFLCKQCHILWKSISGSEYVPEKVKTETGFSWIKKLLFPNHIHGFAKIVNDTKR